jgi:voltage-gated potassium channel
MPALHSRLSSIRYRLCELLEPAKGDYTARHFTPVFVSAVMIIAALSSILETLPELEKYSYYFSRAETFFGVLFTVEFLLRLWVAPCASELDTPARSRRKYVLSFYGFIDVLVILPFFIGFMIPGVNLYHSPDLVLIRACHRLLS